MKRNLLSVVVLLCMSFTVKAQTYADTVLTSIGVNDAYKAVSADKADYATMSTVLGVLNQSKLKLGYHPYGFDGMKGFVRIQPESGLISAEVLQALNVSLYNASGKKVAEKNGFSLADVDLLTGTDNIYLLNVPTKEKTSNVASVEITLTGLVTLSYTLRIYDSYLAFPCNGSRADSVIRSNNVLRPDNVITPSRDDYATMGNILFAPSSLLVHLTGSNYNRVKYLLGTSGVISAELLSDIMLIAYDSSGNVITSRSDFSLADIEVLEGNKFFLSLRVPRDSHVNSTLISYNGPLHLLAPLLVYRVTINNTSVQVKPYITPNVNATFCGRDSVKLLANPNYKNQNVSWQWYRENKSIAGATNDFYYAKQQGKYFVQVTSADGCSNLSDEVAVVRTTCAQAVSPEANSLQVYPNPFNGSAKLRLNSNQSGIVSISDKSGRVIETVKVNANQSAIILRSANAGIYFIKLTTTDGKIFTAKAIKEK